MHGGGIAGHIRQIRGRQRRIPRICLYRRLAPGVTPIANTSRETTLASPSLSDQAPLKLANFSTAAATRACCSGSGSKVTGGGGRGVGETCGCNEWRNR